MGTLFSLLTFILLLALTAFFVATEFAIVKVRASRINQLAEANHRQALAAKKVVTHLDEYLAACQLGITITALGIGMVGESTFEFILHPFFSMFGMSETLIHVFTLLSAFVIATYLHVVIGEMAPKTIAIQKAEQITLYIAKPIIMFYKLFYPFIYILNGSARIILRLFGMKPAKESEIYHSEEELKLLLKESHDGGAITKGELTHINRAFDFDNMIVQDGYIPLSQTAMFSADTTLSEAKAVINDSNYSRYPVYINQPNNIIGYVHAKDLLNEAVQSLADVTHDILTVDLATKYQSVLEQMKQHHVHIALVKSTNQIYGIITMENILENIVGDIQDEHDQH